MKSAFASAARRWLKRAGESRVLREIRGETRLLCELHERLASSLQGSRCIVIGSAPGVIVPPVAPDDRCICVNGSPYVANQLGILNPDLTVINGFTTARKTEKSKATVPIWKGLRTQEIIFVRVGDSEKHAREVLNEVGFQHSRFTKLSKHQRAAIIRDVCGVELAPELGLGSPSDRLSNGMFAACIAVWAGAREIVMCGFSLLGGHSYIEGDTPRSNLDGDTAFLAIAKNLKCGFKTTSAEIHKSFGIPLVASAAEAARPTRE